MIDDDSHRHCDSDETDACATMNAGMMTARMATIL